MQYNFYSKQNGSARNILIGLVLFAVLAILLAILFTHSMSDVANKQLKYITKGNLEDAYKLTSKIYQDKNNFQAFTDFVNSNPILKQHESVTFTIRKIQGFSGYLSGPIIGLDKKKMLLEYEFIKQERHWEIQDIKLSPIGDIVAVAGAPVDNAGASIQGVIVSDTADKKDFVDIEKPIIAKSAPKIYVTVQIVSPKGGTTVSAILTTAPGQKIGPSVQTVSNPGDTIKAFYFIPTTATWVPGDYRVDVTLSTGASQATKFKVQ